MNAGTATIIRVYSQGGTQIYYIPPADHPPALLTTSLPVQVPALPSKKDVMLDVPDDAGACHRPFAVHYGSMGDRVEAKISRLWLLCDL